MWSGKSLQLLCIFPFGMLCLSNNWYLRYDVCKKYVGSVYVGVYGGLSESRLYLFRELCPISFLVVGDSPSVLLLYVVMSYDNCDDDG